MKRNLRAMMLVATVAALASVAGAQTTYTWEAPGGGDYATAANWNPDRTTPATNDILVFDGAATTDTLTVTGLVAETIGELHLVNNAYLKLQASTASKTLAIAGDASPKDLEVAAGSTLELNGSIQIIISVAAAANGVINGDVLYTATASTVPMQLRAGQVDGIIFESGATAAMAPTAGGGGGGFAAGVAAGVRFKDGAEFHHGGTKIGTFNGGTGSNAFVASPALTVWETNSTYILEEGLPSVSGRTYGNLTWRCGISQSSSGGASPWVVNGNLTFAPSTPKASAGVWTLNGQTAPITVNGNFVVMSGANATGFVDGTLASPANFNLNGNVDIQDPSKFTPSVSANRTYVLGGSASQSLNFQGKTLPNLNLNNASGAVLASDVAVSGNLTLTTGTITTGANKVVLGTAATVSGAGSIQGTVARIADGSATGPSVVPIYSAGGEQIPVTFNITTAGSGTGQFIATPLSAPSNPLPVDAVGINRAWTLESTGISTPTLNLDLTVTYLDGDLGSATEADLKLARWDGSQWVVNTGTTVNTAANTATAIGVTALSEWTLLVPPSTSFKEWSTLSE